MGKQTINSFITKMKKGGVVTRVTPWMFEQDQEVRYVGVRPIDWQEIFSTSNNILFKFSVADHKDHLQILFANNPPFIQLVRLPLTKLSKWETILGELKRTLKKDKKLYQSHTYQIDNLYLKILGKIKK